MRFSIIVLVFLLVAGCGGEPPQDDTSSGYTRPQAKEEKVDDGIGVGEIKQVTLNDPLDVSMVKRGKAIFEMKCSACHRLSDKRIVGPGFAGITERRKPAWIMNMITNVEMMLEEDPTAQALLEECLTRMPNQNVTIGDARDLLEFFYENDTSSD